MITKLIFGVAGAEVVILVTLLALAHYEKERDLKRGFSFFEALNNVYIAIVSIFPLLGMLGTVIALLNLDMTGNTEGLKNNFFQALDTTEWGIICAVVFKIIYAFVEHFIEEQITRGKEIQRERYNR